MNTNNDLTQRYAKAKNENKSHSAIYNYSIDTNSYAEM